MLFLIVFLCCMAVCYLLQRAIHKCPIAFYAGSIVIVAVYFAGAFGILSMPLNVWKAFFELIQESTLALALFMVVMFVGVTKSTSTLGMKLRGIRGEVSIIAWIFTLGHVVFYLVRWAPYALTSANTSANAYVSFAVSIILLILLLLLGVTSFKSIKKRMPLATWTKIQKTAYLFIGLIYVHLMVILLPSALAGGEAAIESAIIYSVIFGAYAIGRIIRWRLDAADKKKEATEVASEKSEAEETAE